MAEQDFLKGLSAPGSDRWTLPRPLEARARPGPRHVYHMPLVGAGHRSSSGLRKCTRGGAAVGQQGWHVEGRQGGPRSHWSGHAMNPKPVTHPLKRPLSEMPCPRGASSLIAGSRKPNVFSLQLFWGGFGEGTLTSTTQDCVPRLDPKNVYICAQDTGDHTSLYVMAGSCQQTTCLPTLHAQ